MTIHHLILKIIFFPVGIALQYIPSFLLRMVYQRVRPDNFCLSCGAQWIPRGQSLSVKCPHCKSSILLSSHECYHLNWGVVLLSFLLCAMLSIIPVMMSCSHLLLWPIGIICWMCCYTSLDVKQKSEIAFAMEIHKKLIYRGWTNEDLRFPSLLSEHVRSEVLSKHVPNETAHNASKLPLNQLKDHPDRNM